MFPIFHSSHIGWISWKNAGIETDWVVVMGVAVLAGNKATQPSLAGAWAELGKSEKEDQFLLLCTIQDCQLFPP